MNPDDITLNTKLAELNINFAKIKVIAKNINKDELRELGKYLNIIGSDRSTIDDVLKLISKIEKL